MRTHSKTTKLFNDPDFQDYMLSNYYVNIDGNLVGKRGKVLRGSDNGLGYRITSIMYKGKSYSLLLHRLAFLVAHERVPGEIDHIDGDRSNNNLFNLREVTHSQNMARISKQVRENTSSKFKGVSSSNGKRWKVLCGSDYLGVFDCEIEAAREYDRQAYITYGPDAWLNFPPQPRA